ncbi:unnamed protein product [Peniophora sp. CBMAI 1063]|nr:unnamed protein product [Peniophora sp. CBMAI 1063]
MPPGPAYNWLAAAHSLAQILEHAAHYRASQVSGTRSRATPFRERAQGAQEDIVPANSAESRPSNSLHRANEEWQRALAIPARASSSRDHLTQPLPVVPEDELFNPLPSSSRAPEPSSGSETPSKTIPVVPEDELFNPTPSSSQTPSSAARTPGSTPAQQPLPVVPEDEIFNERPTSSSPPPATVSPSTSEVEHSSQRPDLPAQGASPAIQAAASDASPLASAPLEAAPLVDAAVPQARRTLQSSRVPSSRIGRFFHYGGLAASLGYGAATELLRGGGSSGSLMMTEANISRLVGKLSQMRGAALKVGQFLSIQDTHVLPPEVEKVFRRVQDSAHYMPNWQMEKVMTASLGDSWRDNFVSFDPIPFAAASIGQVHRAVLSASVSPTGKDEAVAVKIQFPNIRQSVESDIGYLKVLLTAGQLLPKGLFLDKTIAAMKEELADECDYTREANFLRTFGDADHFGGNDRFKVPWVWDGSSQTVLVMEHVDGKSVGGELVERLSQKDKDDIASRIIELCLLELFRFRAMQTDPNWTNFLWNERTRQVELVDFGATRTYSGRFMDDWLRLLSAAAAGDHDACVEASLALGYLTGQEEDVMVRAHVRSMQLLATPFRQDTVQPFAFGPGSEWTSITKEIRDQIPVMLQHRLTPPPRETYSLNRKLSGAFLLASRLGARVDCRKLWEETTKDYVFGQE